MRKRIEKDTLIKILDCCIEDDCSHCPNAYKYSGIAACEALARGFVTIPIAIMRETNEALKAQPDNNHVDREANRMKFGCTFVRCVTSGEGFEKGVTYPVLGWNDGINIMRQDANGDPFNFVACTGGIGEGEFNNFNGSGKPSFEATSLWTVKWHV